MINFILEIQHVVAKNKRNQRRKGQTNRNRCSVSKRGINSLNFPHIKPARVQSLRLTDLAEKEPKPIAFSEILELSKKISVLPEYSLFLLTVRSIVGAHMTRLALRYPKTTKHPEFKSPLPGLEKVSRWENIEPIRYKLKILFINSFSLEDDSQFLQLQQLVTAVTWTKKQGFEQKIFLVLLVREKL